MHNVLKLFPFIVLDPMVQIQRQDSMRDLPTTLGWYKGQEMKEATHALQCIHQDARPLDVQLWEFVNCRRGLFVLSWLIT
jgi:hypothetical protein